MEILAYYDTSTALLQTCLKLVDPINLIGHLKIQNYIDRKSYFADM